MAKKSMPISELKNLMGETGLLNSGPVGIVAPGELLDTIEERGPVETGDTLNRQKETVGEVITVSSTLR
ncbi:MAG: hypothetical protein LBC51_04520 [Treponema sp.]|jgi:hypothetical protein|nr:hypothetical protein [Treponema sp.]